MITPAQRTPSEVNNQTGQRAPVAPARANTAQQALPQWAVGQLLKATLVQQLNANTVLLNIGKQTLTASLARQDQAAGQAQTSRLPIGAEISLKVLQTGSQPLVQIQEMSTAQRLAQLSAEGLRQALPKQQPLNEFFSRLQNLVGSESRLPPNIQNALQQIQAQIVTRGALQTPENVKRAMIESGVFLESSLARTPASAINGQDLKAQLLRLSSLLNAQANLAPTVKQQAAQDAKVAMQSAQAQNLASSLSLDMPTLQRHVESALARIQLNQLQAVSGLEQAPHGLLIEMPVKDQKEIDVFNFHIEDQDQQEGKGKDSQLWSLMLSFEMEGLGAMHVRLTLGEDQIRASVWAENDNTFDLVETHLPDLRDRLEDVAFVDPQVRCFKGKPEEILHPLEHTDELIDIEI